MGVFTDVGWWLFPGRCVLCELPSGRQFDLCAWCEDALPRIARPCPRCALPIPDSARHCAPCTRATPVWSHTVAALEYPDEAAQMINRLKHGGALVHARVLAGLLADVVRASDAPQPHAILPVPLHRSRARARGYDQSAEIVRALTRVLGIPADLNALQRVRATRPQQDLSRRQRAINLRGAFRVVREPLPAHVAIIDDVLTTGATASAVTRALLAAGARRVDLWVVARTR